MLCEVDGPGQVADCVVSQARGLSHWRSHISTDYVRNDEVSLDVPHGE